MNRQTYWKYRDKYKSKLNQREKRTIAVQTFENISIKTGREKEKEQRESY